MTKAPSEDLDQLRQDVLRVVAGGSEVEAVKLVRARTGAGLVEARRFVLACTNEEPYEFGDSPDHREGVVANGGKLNVAATAMLAICAAVLVLDSAVEVAERPGPTAALRLLLFVLVTIYATRSLIRARRS